MNSRPTRTSEQLATELDRIEQAEAELEAFAFMVSHDLRAPLRAMQGFSEALLEDYAGDLDATAQDYLHRIVGAAERMDQRLQALSDYSHICRVEIRPQAINLDQLVARALADLRATIVESDARLTTASDLPAVTGHRPTLLKVISQLLRNALTFVTPGQAPRVRIGAETRGEWVRLWIEDGGIGIDPRHHQRIFRVFERLHGIESYPGTGIGLAMVRKGMERMGGRVGLESQLDAGSRFWLELPPAA